MSKYPKHSLPKYGHFKFSIIFGNWGFQQRLTQGASERVPASALRTFLTCARNSETVMMRSVRLPMRSMRLQYIHSRKQVLRSCFCSTAASSAGRISCHNRHTHLENLRGKESCIDPSCLRILQKSAECCSPNTAASRTARTEVQVQVESTSAASRSTVLAI